MNKPFHIEPRCFPFDKDGNNIKDKMQNCPAHTASGYLLPCCWLDRSNIVANNDDLNGIRVPELHLRNKITYEQIMKSKQWKNFYKQLFEDPEKAHDICKECCGWVTHDDGSKQEFWKYKDEF
jgi:hypothetical protein|tara:strand:+ start:896 stop:1264 length:369 start_codon:yes stop_codon:yes gene_type:complete